MGAPGSLVYMYLGEFHAERHRAKSICFLGFFFTLAWLILPGITDSESIICALSRIHTSVFCFQTDFFFFKYARRKKSFSYMINL